MPEIKVLDCTLRDGGYVNKWEFGQNCSLKIFNNLNNAKIDYIEAGFLKDCEYSSNKTLFNSIEQVNNITAKTPNITSKLIAMIVYGQFDESKILPKTENYKLDGIRVTFKKPEIEHVFSYLEKIKDCGYELFVNPTNIDTYSDLELLQLISKVNELKPYGFSIVDTNGILKEGDLLRLYYLIDNNLDKDIALCFHSHNNLQLSFSNAQCLMKICKNRELIIDSTVFGMGRGAGNLCTELLTQYLIDNYSGEYELVPILKIVDEQINPIFAKTPWGYSVPYYLAATNHCHPNYAKYLVDKQSVPVEMINNLLQSIPDNKKAIFDSNLIKQIYLDNFSNVIDDTRTIEHIAKELKDRQILLLAPGKSLSKEKDKIDEFIKHNNPYIISLNFIPESFEEDMVFITNLKRFSSLNDYTAPLVVTSNIDNIPDGARVLNYSSYLNDSKMFDNVALMFLKLLINLGIKTVNIAGLDGFSPIASENYVSDELINNAKVAESEFDERNEIMIAELKKFEKEININFLTKSYYLCSC